jgi:hypothetical protein
MLETFLIICFVIAFVIFLLIPGSGLLLIALLAGRKSKAGQNRRRARVNAYNEGLARMEDRIRNIETIMSDR